MTEVKTYNMDRAAIFEILSQTNLLGNPSEEYEAGFWDCYQHICENFEKGWELWQQYNITEKTNGQR